MQGLIDMHCHIVPGVDDGARDLYDAAKILQLEYRNQVQAVIVTGQVCLRRRKERLSGSFKELMR